MQNIIALASGAGIPAYAGAVGTERAVGKIGWRLEEGTKEPDGQKYEHSYPPQLSNTRLSWEVASISYYLLNDIGLHVSMSEG